MAQPVIVPPFGECWSEVPDGIKLAAIAQAVQELAFGGSVGPAITYASSPSVATSDGAIPAGVKSWGFTVVSGTVTLNGSGTLPVGATFSGGGYQGATLSSALSYTIAAGGSALVTYDT